MNANQKAASCNPLSGRCQICGDEAVAGRVIAIDDALRTAAVLVEGETVTVALDLVEAQVGDELLVHMGFAIETLEPRRPACNEGESLRRGQATGIHA